jgi:hypothetical protein
MKTFSAMSAPDMQLTLLAYDQLITLLEMSLKSGMNSPRETIEKHKLKIFRLRQLMEALEVELLSQ